MLSSATSNVWFNYATPTGMQGDESIGQYVGWGAEFADFDNDLDLDASVMFGYIDTGTGARQSLLEANGMFLQGEDGAWSNVSQEWNVDSTGSSRGVVAADLNDDGYVDLAYPQLDGPSQIRLSNCGDKAWLKVRLHQPAPNVNAIGAEIRVQVGDTYWERTLRAGGTGYASGPPPEAHFGLAEYAQVDSVTVMWPNGETSVFRDLDTRQALEITRLPE
jgi:hypothetical protein